MKIHGVRGKGREPGHGAARGGAMSEAHLQKNPALWN